MAALGAFRIDGDPIGVRVVHVLVDGMGSVRATSTMFNLSASCYKIATVPASPMVGLLQCSGTLVG